MKLKIFVIVLMIMFLVKLIIFIIILGDDGPDNVLRNSIWRECNWIKDKMLFFWFKLFFYFF
jgi:hypothetical protein